MADICLNKTENEYRVEPSLKKNIRFFVHNLMDELPPKEYDLVFFRNAFIYFSHRNRGRVLLNLSKVLKEGGILLLGVSETAGAHNACFDAGLGEKSRKDVFYFQKESQKKGLFTETEPRNKIKPVSS
jgi:chemotaxis methyl-accepting protein methylase